MTHSVRISVVVASQNRPNELRQCLQCVRKALSPKDEIIVVDSASTAPDAVRDVAVSAGARLVRTELCGSARARNLGILHARGRLIAFTDDDAMVDSGWIKALVSRFSDPTVTAVVGPVFELGSAQPKLLCSYTGFDAASDVTSFSRATSDWFSRLHYGAIGSGANLGIRRSAFEQHGFFPEGLGRGAPIPG